VATRTDGGEKGETAGGPAQGSSRKEAAAAVWKGGSQVPSRTELPRVHITGVVPPAAWSPDRCGMLRPRLVALLLAAAGAPAVRVIHPSFLSAQTAPLARNSNS